MSLPETLVYGGAVPAQTAGLAYTMNKSNYGRYVLSSNLVDSQVALTFSNNQRKDGALDTWIRFEQFRNASLAYGGGFYNPAEKQDDRLFSVQMRAIGPLSTNSSDGRFTQEEALARIRGMGSILYELNLLERVMRGEL